MCETNNKKFKDNYKNLQNRWLKIIDIKDDDPDTYKNIFVKVIRKDNEFINSTWPLAWSDCKDKYLGRTGKINKITNNAIHVLFDNETNDISFPYNSLDFLNNRFDIGDIVSFNECVHNLCDKGTIIDITKDGYQEEELY